MGYIILSKQQLNGGLNVKLCKDRASADLYRKQLIKLYYDVVILDKSDYDVVTSKLFKEWVNEEDNDGGDDNNPDPIWNGESEDLLVNRSDEKEDSTPQYFHEDEDGDEYYLSSNGKRYYLFEKVVTLKGDREQTIYTFGPKTWLEGIDGLRDDLTLLRFYNIPYGKCVVESKSGYPFLKTEFTLNGKIKTTSKWDL